MKKSLVFFFKYCEKIIWNFLKLYLDSFKIFWLKLNRSLFCFVVMKINNFFNEIVVWGNVSKWVLKVINLVGEVVIGFICN